jgi:hypothetical protein
MTNGERQRWMSLPVFVLACLVTIAVFMLITGCASQQDEWRGISKVIQRSGA